MVNIVTTSPAISDEKPSDKVYLGSVGVSIWKLNAVKILTINIVVKFLFQIVFPLFKVLSPSYISKCNSKISFQRAGRYDHP